MSARPLSLDRSALLPSADQILENLPHPVLLIDALGDITYANCAAQGALGGMVAGLQLRDVFPGCPASPAEWSGKTTPRQIVTKLDAAFDAVLGPVGADHWIVSLHPALSPDAGRTAEVDELTGLFRRTGLNESLDRALSPYGGDQGLVAVHCLDLDRFKIINDTLGHAVGDLLLKKVSDRLRNACRKGDCIARIGGDEFVIVQTGITSLDDAEKLAKRVVDLVGRTYVLNGHTINIGVSVGVALHAEPLLSRDLLRNGDLALYEAKRAGRGRYRVFAKEMDVSLRERRELEIDLRRALALKQFELHYQPFLEVDTDTVIGFEALLRWNHPIRGQVSPLSFIPLAEETGLINQIGEWVLRTACAEASCWPNGLTVAVNVSPVQFKADALVTVITSALAHAGLAANRLEVEITEGALLENTDIVLKTLHALRDLGIQISMDDFGTGYSSLSYLQKFPFHKIKIDRSFVQAAQEGGDSEAILKAIAGLGVSLGMSITAEGVETADQLRHIRDERCTHVQGYFTGRPMTAAAVSAFLES